MNRSVLIIDTMHPSLMEMLAFIQLEADYRPDIQRDEIIRILPNYIGMVVRSKTNIDAELLQNALQLQFIARAGSGMDLIDLDALATRNIQVINAPEGNRDAVAEHTIGLILSLFRKIHIADQEVRHLNWKREENRGYEIKGKTIAIIGYGNVGQQLAKRLNAFDCRILVYDIRKKNFSYENIQEATMEEIFEQADILSIHTPLTELTRRMIDDRYLAQFHKNIMLINTARGEIVCMETLQKGLESGKIIGAGLDVLENEKLHSFNENQKQVFDYLKNSNRVIFTPHIAGWTYESYFRINEVLIEKIKKLLNYA